MCNKTIFNISFTCYLLYAIMECLSVPFPRVLQWGFFVVWLGLFLTSYKLGRIKGGIALLIFLLFVFVCSVPWGITTVLGRLLTMLETISPFFAFLFYKDDRRKIKTFLIVFLTILAVNEVLAFRNLSAIMESGLRETLSSNASYEQEVFKNGFAFVYTLSIFVPLLVYALIHHKQWRLTGNRHNWWFIVLILLTVAFTVFVYVSMFTTALLIVGLGLILAFLYGRKYWILKSVCIIGVSVFVFLAFYQELLSAIGSNSAATAFISIRIEEIYLALTGDVAQAADLNSRSKLMSLSFNTFLKNPLTGVYSQLPSFNAYRASGIGNHSEWLDMLGLYGMFAFLLFWFISRVVVDQKEFSGVMIPIYLYLLIGFVNPVWATFTNLYVFLVIPFLLSYLFEKKVKLSV